MTAMKEEYELNEYTDYVFALAMLALLLNSEELSLHDSVVRLPAIKRLHWVVVLEYCYSLGSIRMRSALD